MLILLTPLFKLVVSTLQPLPLILLLLVLVLVMSTLIQLLAVHYTHTTLRAVTRRCPVD
jgi:hypothetical protein